MISVEKHRKYSNLVPGYKLSPQGLMYFRGKKLPLRYIKKNQYPVKVPCYLLLDRKGQLKYYQLNMLMATFYVKDPHPNDGRRVVKHKNGLYNDCRPRNLIWVGVSNADKLKKRVYLYNKDMVEIIFEQLDDVRKLGLSPSRCSQIARKPNKDRRGFWTKGYTCSYRSLKTWELESRIRKG